MEQISLEALPLEVISDHVLPNIDSFFALIRAGMTCHLLCELISAYLTQQFDFTSAIPGLIERAKHAPKSVEQFICKYLPSQIRNNDDAAFNYAIHFLVNCLAHLSAADSVEALDNWEPRLAPLLKYVYDKHSARVSLGPAMVRFCDDGNYLLSCSGLVADELIYKEIFLSCRKLDYDTMCRLRPKRRVAIRVRAASDEEFKLLAKDLRAADEISVYLIELAMFRSAQYPEVIVDLLQQHEPFDTFEADILVFIVTVTGQDRQVYDTIRAICPLECFEELEQIIALGDDEDVVKALERDGLPAEYGRMIHFFDMLLAKSRSFEVFQTFLKITGRPYLPLSSVCEPLIDCPQTILLFMDLSDQESIRSVILGVAPKCTPRAYAEAIRILLETKAVSCKQLNFNMFFMYSNRTLVLFEVILRSMIAQREFFDIQFNKINYELFSRYAAYFLTTLDGPALSCVCSLNYDQPSPWSLKKMVHEALLSLGLKDQHMR